jgi:hypothetical protein
MGMKKAKNKSDKRKVNDVTLPPVPPGYTQDKLTKEQHKVFKKHFAPLLDKIDKLAQKYKIPYLADFAVGKEHVISASIGGSLGGQDNQFLALAVLCPDIPEIRANADKIMLKKLLTAGGGGLGSLVDNLEESPLGSMVAQELEKQLKSELGLVDNAKKDGPCPCWVCELERREAAQDKVEEENGGPNEILPPPSNN